VVFAAALLLLGAFNLSDGLAAVSRSHFFASDATLVSGSPSSRSWLLLCLGMIGLVAGAGLFVNLFVPGYTFWGMSVVTLEMPQRADWPGTTATRGRLRHGGRCPDGRDQERGRSAFATGTSFWFAVRDRPIRPDMDPVSPSHRNRVRGDGQLRR
jgi:hypothetical protein